ncbi:MAG: hypothetical protein AAGJ18_05025, partial [Bacteroidota bacterium]
FRLRLAVQPVRQSLADPPKGLFLAFYANTEVVVSTALFSTFIVWTLLMLMVYWIKKPWVSWAILTSITLVLGVGIYLAKTSM